MDSKNGYTYFPSDLIKGIYHCWLRLFFLPIAGKEPFLREFEDWNFETEILKMMKLA